MRKPFWSEPWISDVKRIVIGPPMEIKHGGGCGVYRDITFINDAGGTVLSVHGKDAIAVQLADMEAEGAP